MAPPATPPPSNPAMHAAYLDAVTPHAVVLFHRDGAIQHANRAAQRFGLTNGHVIAAGLEQMRLFSLDTKALVDTTLWLDTDPARPLRTGWIAPGGSEHMVELTRAAVDDQWQILTLTDRSSEWRLRSALAQADSGDDPTHKLRRLAHDLANAFGVAQIAADSLGKLTIPSSAGRHLSSILDACKRGDTLIQSLLDEPRSAMIVPSHVDVGASLAHVAQLAMRVMPRKTTFTRDIAPGRIMVACRRADLDAAVMHLLANGRKAIATAGIGQGTLRIAVNATQSDVQISVEDNGAGLPDEVINQRPDPYLSLPNAMGGSGVGLAIVETFAWRTGGTLHMENRAEGGCRVTLTLPRAELPDDAIHATEANPTLFRDLSGYRILLVDADDPFRLVLSEALRGAGARLAEASTGTEALRVLGYKTPDIVISSHSLPDGMGASDLVAAQPGIAVLSLTAAGDVIDPATQFMMLRKPIRLEELENAIQLVAPRPHAPD
ncbi:hybrid sensor histidine kinase/response regulator [Gymnodinialimonas sp. 2305UL16-5]|uniref:hybrid sensor histidine kinase/response regulator n=1 Tax=Gymnodinialimonas mytili TaxID=3126503 RepID=UPI003098100A